MAVKYTRPRVKVPGQSGAKSFEFCYYPLIKVQAEYECWINGFNRIFLTQKRIRPGF